MFLQRLALTVSRRIRGRAEQADLGSERADLGRRTGRTELAGLGRRAGRTEPVERLTEQADRGSSLLAGNWGR